MSYLSRLRKLAKQHKNLLFVSLTTTAVLISADAQAFTLDDALLAAHENNYDLRSQYESLNSTKLETPKAYTGFLPTVSGAVNNTKTKLQVPAARNNRIANGLKEDVNTRSLTINQPIFNGGKTFSSIKVADNVVESSKEQFKAASNKISLQAVSAYEGVLTARDIYKLNLNNEKVLTESLRLTQTRFEHGEVTKTDVLQAESSLSSAISARERAYGNLKAAEALFIRTVGVDLPEHMEPISLKNVSLPGSMEELLELALKSNPDLLASKYNSEASKFQVAQAYSTILPSVSASATYNRSDLPKTSTNSTDSNTYALNLTVPFFQSGAEYVGIFQSQYKSKSAEFSYKEADRQVRETAVKVWSSYKVSQSVIKSSEEAITANQKALDGVREEAKAGTRTTLDILNQQQAVFSAEVDKRSAMRDLVVAVYSIQQLIGTLGIADIVIDGNS